MSYAPQVPDPQDQLSLYEELREVAREKELLRCRIMHLLDQGAAVEPGNLYVEIKPQEVRLLTAESLGAVLGPDRVEELRSQIEPTIRRCLIVRAVPSWPRQAPGQGWPPSAPSPR